MKEEEAKTKILKKISVTRQKTTIAKAIILELVEKFPDTNLLLKELLKRVDAQMPERIILNPAVDPLPTIATAAEVISWQVAACEAIWELIHDNLVILKSSAHTNVQSHIEWTTVVKHSGGNTSGWNFNEFDRLVPQELSLSLSHKSSDEFLVNSDLYLHNLAIMNLHPEIELALREAIRCFRHDLFTASATMLGKASEGAWLELGSALILTLSLDGNKRAQKLITALDNPNHGIRKKIETVLELYEQHDLFDQIKDKSGISIQNLRLAANWADTVRDSRNTIHFGVAPSIPNSYEKVAALLMGAVPNFRLIYKVLSACELN